MRKLRIKYSNENFFNIGNVLKVYYIVFFKKKKRIYCFIGFCFFKNKAGFKLINVIKKQRIVLTLNENSPFILKIFNLKMYRIYIKRVSKLYFKIKSHYKDDYTVLKNRIVSSYHSFKSRYFRQAYFRRKRTKNKRIHKLKLKFKRAESWFFYLNRNLFKTNIFESNSFLINFSKKLKYSDIVENLYAINNVFFLNKNFNYNILNKIYSDNSKLSLLKELYIEVFDDVYDYVSRGDKIFNKNNWIKVKLN